MVKAYLLNKLTQSTVWIGVIIIVSSFFLPRHFIMFEGILFMLTDDKHINAIFTRFIPWIGSLIDEIAESV